MNRVLDPLVAGQVVTLAEAFAEPWQSYAAVTLTDGETIAGHPGASLPVAGLSGIMFADSTPTTGSWQFMDGTDLVVSHSDLYDELRIYIPAGDVAGIRRLAVSQQVFRLPRPDEDAEAPDPRAAADRLYAEYLSQFPAGDQPVRAAQHKRREAAARREYKRYRAAADEAADRRSQESARRIWGLPPLDAGAAEFDVTADALQRARLDAAQRRLWSLLRVAALRTAQRHGYRIERLSFGIAYRLLSTVEFEGDFEPGPGERLYVDWDYVSRNREGLTGAGFGFVVSLSLSFNTSAARAARQLARRPRAELTAICGEKLALVRGHVAFLDVPGSAVERRAVSTGRSLDMDGGTWRAAIICADPIASAPGPQTPWVLSYWKEGREEVPLDLLDASVVPLDIFGSVQSGRARTSFGQASCFLKVHYAAAAAT
jgi:hypothetical protein